MESDAQLHAPTVTGGRDVRGHDHSLGRLTVAARALTVALAAASLFGPAAAGGIQRDARLSIRLLPESSRVSDPRALVYIVDHRAPGATVRRVVEVTNHAGHRLRVRIYAAGAEVSEGAFRFFDGRESNELSSWTIVTPVGATLDAGSTQPVTVRIGLPRDASAGERYAVVWAEASGPEPPNGGVRQVSRVGVRIYLSVGEGGPPPSDFEITRLRAGASGARPLVIADVRNTGGRALDLSGRVELSNGPGGVRAGPFPVPTGTTVAVSASAKVSVPLEQGLAAGPWDVILVLRSGAVERTERARLTFSTSGDRTPPVARRSGLPSWVALAVGAPIVTTLTAVGFVLRRRRRIERRSEPRERTADQRRGQRSRTHRRR